MRLRTSLTTRQGRKVPRHLYWQRGTEPADGDPVIGLVDTPEVAALIVAAVNGCGLTVLGDAAAESLRRIEAAR